MLDPRFEAETEKLKRSWTRQDRMQLRDYLVADVEDPRINVQSILSRHFLIEAAVGRRHVALQKQELRFAIVCNWLLGLFKSAAPVEDLESLLHALKTGGDNAEGLEIPAFVSEAWARLAEVNGNSPADRFEALMSQLLERDERPLTLQDEQLNFFQRTWSSVLCAEAPNTISVVEPACGSANDYRFLHAYGIANAIDYTGFDLCKNNILNAKEMFPNVRFREGNVLAIEASDKEFDLCFFHDLLEHLSIEAMERAVAEICRVTRESVCANFFSMFEADDHIVREVDDYHWNTLSLNRVCKLFGQHGFGVQVMHIDTFLKWKFGYDQTHNKNAYTILFRR